MGGEFARQVEIPITAATRCETWTVSAHSNTGISGSNLTRDMDVWMRFFCLRTVLCVGRGLMTGWSSLQGVISTIYKYKKLIKASKGPTMGCRATDDDDDDNVCGKKRPWPSWKYSLGIYLDEGHGIDIVPEKYCSCYRYLESVVCSSITRKILSTLS
jgi:hypothetical protein